MPKVVFSCASSIGVHSVASCVEFDDRFEFSHKSRDLGVQLLNAKKCKRQYSPAFNHSHRI